MLDSLNPREATNWRAVCGKTACTVRWGVGGLASPPPTQSNKALTEAKSKYREISKNRAKQLQDFSETSPTIRKIDAELASQESVVRKALQLRDQADHQMFIELD